MGIEAIPDKQIGDCIDDDFEDVLDDETIVWRIRRRVWIGLSSMLSLESVG
jgi:hypothetical protein